MDDKLREGDESSAYLRWWSVINDQLMDRIQELWKIWRLFPQMKTPDEFWYSFCSWMSYWLSVACPWLRVLLFGWIHLEEDAVSYQLRSHMFPWHLVVRRKFSWSQEFSWEISRSEEHWFRRTIEVMKWIEGELTRSSHPNPWTLNPKTSLEVGLQW